MRRKKKIEEKIVQSVNKIVEISSKVAKKFETTHDSQYSIHTLKKIIALAKYLPAFTAIANSMYQKRKIQGFHYIDLLAGSGMFKIEKDPVPIMGSAIIGYLCPLLSSFRRPKPFTQYYYVEYDSKKCEILSKRLNFLEKEMHIYIHSPPYDVWKGDCNTEINRIINNITQEERRNSLNFVFIDPEGFEEVEWRTVELTLSELRGDIMITFMSRHYARTLSTNPQILKRFFGEDVSNITDVNLALKKYKERVRKHRRYILNIRVEHERLGRYYDIIFATNSEAGYKIMQNIKNMLEKMKTNTLKRIYEVLTGKSTSLEDYMNVGNILLYKP